jgi:hypothetical protein
LQSKIILVFSSSDDKNIIFAECKWRNDIKDLAILNKLHEKAELFSNYKNQYFYIFSKVSFLKECHALAAKAGNIKLIMLSRLFEG